MDTYKLQELASDLVSREVYYCVSNLMGYVGSNLEAACKLFDEDYDASFGLFRRTNYEDAFDETVRDALDDGELFRLEEICDAIGYWCDVLNELGWDEEQHGEFSDWYESFEDGGAIKAGMKTVIKDYIDAHAGDYEELCAELDIDIESFDSEVYEHWIVSNWLSRKLEARGEVVGEFAGLTIWGRTCSGQSISMDGVIEDIVRELHSDTVSHETAHN